MRIAVYNQMFGLAGSRFFGNVVGHYYIHFQKNPKEVFLRMDLSKTIKTVKKAGADIIGICEIYEGAEKRLVRGLKKIGYKYFYFGRGHKFEFNDRHVIELIASKIKGKQYQFKEWPVKSELGGGGGFVVCHFPKLKLNVFHVHMGLPIRRLFPQQIKHMQKILKRLKGKTIIMGDFNCTYEKVGGYFPSFKLVTGRIKTCSFTPIIRWFVCKDMDHILVKGLKKKGVGTLLGSSDHKLIWADLE